MSEERKSLFRVVHNKNYTIINNHICKDKRLSYKAKGIWLYAFSRPDDWQFYESDIVNQSNDGKYAVKAGLKELEEAGYLVKERAKDSKNRFTGWDYIFYELPCEIQKKFPKREKPNVGDFPDRKNQTLLSTDLLPIPEEQQQMPNGDVVVFDKELMKVDLSRKDKSSIINYALKNKISKEDFANAISFVTAPDFVVNTTLTKSIMWALKEKPEVPQPINVGDNRKLAEAAAYILESNSWNLDVLSSKVLFSSKTPNNSTTYEVNFSEQNFKEKLDKLLKQCRFTKHQRS